VIHDATRNKQLHRFLLLYVFSICTAIIQLHYLSRLLLAASVRRCTEELLVGKTVVQNIRHSLLPCSFIDMNNDVLAGGTQSTGFLSHFPGTAPEAHILCSLSEEQPVGTGAGASSKPSTSSKCHHRARPARPPACALPTEIPQLETA